MVTQGELARLHELLRECLVQVDGREGQRVTVGFMVAPGYLLTTAHAAGRAPGATVTGSWHGRAWSGQARFASPAAAGGRPAPDIAVVQLADALDHPCARLAHRDPARGTQLSAAWPRERPDGATGQFPVLYAHGAGPDPAGAGWAGHGQGGLLRLVGDRLDLGACGAPVLNLSTGEVCGLVSVAGPDPDSYAVPVSYLREALPPGLARDIFRAHDEYHGRTPTWPAAQEPLWRELSARAQDYQAMLALAPPVLPAPPVLAPPDEAELLRLVALVPSGGLADHPVRLHRLAAGPGLQPLPGELGHVRDLVYLLGDYPHRRGEPHPLILLAELLALDQRAARPSLAAGLRRWAWRIAGAQGTSGGLGQWRRQQAVAVPGAASSGVPGTNDVMSVIAKVENDALTRDRYLLTMWLYESSVSVTVFARDETAYPLAEAMRRLRLRVPEAMGRLDGDAMIELVLPLDLMDEQVDRWRVPGRPYPRASRRDQLVRSHALLGYSHPVVVRDLDRFSDQESRNLARLRWDVLSSQIKGVCLEWVDCEGIRDLDELSELLSAPEHAALAIPGPAGRSPGLPFLETAVQAGVPLAIWRRTPCLDHDPPDGRPCSGERFRADIERGIAATKLDALPHRVRQLRIPPRTPTDSDGYIARDIVLLWDNPDRGPRPWPLHGP